MIRTERGPGHDLETRRKIQTGVLRSIKQRQLRERMKGLTEIDGIKLPRIRIGYRKPEPTPSQVAPSQAKVIELPCGKSFPSIKAAADYLGCDRTTIVYHRDRGTLDDFLARKAMS